jgi:hypothetical protein
MGLVGVVIFTVAYFVLPGLTNERPSMIMLISSIGAYCCGLAIAHELIKINDTLICKTPFIIENVKRMEKISVYLFIISAYVFMKDWLRFKTHIFHYSFDSTGLNTDSGCLIFIMLGVLVLILGKIFKTAIEIKKENDLTI